MKRAGIPAFEASSPSIQSAENDAVGDGGGAPASKTYDDAAVNAMVARAVAKTEAKFKDYSELQKAASRVQELEAKHAELSEQIELAGKSAQEKEAARAAKATATLQAQLAEISKRAEQLQAERDAERGAHQRTRASTVLGQALSAADVHLLAMSKALKLMLDESEIEFDDRGNVAAVTLSSDGLRYGAQDLTKAAAAYLHANPFLANGAKGGAGASRSNGSGSANSQKALHEMSIDELGLMAELADKR